MAGQQVSNGDSDVIAKKKRRLPGDGSIHQRSRDGKWVGCIDFGYRNGKRHRKYYTAATLAEVRTKMSKGMRDKEQGRTPTNDRLTVSDYLLKEWLPILDVAPSTLRTYESVVRCHLVPSIGHIRLARLGQRDVDKLLRDKLDEGRDPRRVAMIREVLRNALNAASDYLTRNVAAEVKPPRQEPREKRQLTPAEAEVLLAGYPGDPLACVVGVGAGNRSPTRRTACSHLG